MEQFNGAIYRAVYTTCKVFKYVVFSGPNTGKKEPEKTTYLDNSHAV